MNQQELDTNKWNALSAQIFDKNKFTRVDLASITERRGERGLFMPRLNSIIDSPILVVRY
jgi:hypothetical protein